MTYRLGQMPRAVTLFVMLALCVAHGTLTRRLQSTHPSVALLGAPPSPLLLEALAGGDTEWVFRWGVLSVQHNGDRYGQFTPLLDYDYARTVGWMKVLDRLNPDSEANPSFAAYYLSQTSRRDDVRQIVGYLAQRAIMDVRREWWWLTMAAYLAESRLHDNGLALRIATPLYDEQSSALPVEAQLWGAYFVHAKGNKDRAHNLFERVLQSDRLSEADRTFITSLLK